MRFGLTRLAVAALVAGAFYLLSVYSEGIREAFKDRGKRTVERPW